jgi:hypothetical protein
MVFVSPILKTIVLNSINSLTDRAFWMVRLSCVLAFLAVVFQGQAQIITLVNNNSLAQINTGSQSGMFRWTVDGGNQLNQQWFWYRVGNNPESSIDTISAPSITTPDAQTLYASYNNGAYGVRVDYHLTGFSVGSGQSDIAETITITNSTASPLDFHFFQYSDFNLNGTAGGDTVQLGKNLRGLFNEADQSKGPGFALTETVVSPGANHGEAAFYNQTLTKLNDAGPTTLNDNAGPVGPGDVTWALEWDFTIAPGSSVGISKDKFIQTQPVPEPTALALICAGLMLHALRRREHS